MQKILYYAEVKDPAVNWVFKFFSTAIGCSFRQTSDLNLASVVYSNSSNQVLAEQLHIPVWQEYYDSTVEHNLDTNGHWVPWNMQDVAVPRIDYVGLVFRLLTLMDELIIANNARDELGNFTVNLHLPVIESSDHPMIDKAVQEFKRELIEHNLLKEGELLPRWPKGKRFAILITHDTDGPCLLEAKELAKAGLKGFAKLNGSERSAFLDGCRRALTGREDPYFNFVHWAEFEQTLEAKSAFYIYVKSKGVPWHTHNPLYRLDKRKKKWNILRELADRGWEIGLHSSIYALERDTYIQTEKNDLENFLGKSILGNRCHYWHINWQNPIESFRYLEATGIIYDSSIAWKDRPGFRSGTVTPYHPYDHQKGSNLKLLEIPTNVMDGHLFEYQVSASPHLWFATIVEQVRAYGGVLNLDWHTRTWVNKFSYAGWRSFLVKELEELASGGEAWFTTPKNLSEHWLLRERQIESN